MADSDRDTTLLEIGKRVRQRRHELGQTQEEVAGEAGVSKSFVSEVESGSTAASGLVYLRLAEALGVTVQWLLTGGPEGSLEPQNRGPAEIPPLVSRIAEELGWSYTKTLDVAAALTRIVARRTRSSGAWQPTKEYILKIAQALEEGDKGR